MHSVPDQVTLEAIPLDVLCEIWEVFDHVEHLICERVSDPQQVCVTCVVPDLQMFICSTLFLWEFNVFLLTYISETLATHIIYYTTALSESPCLKHVCIVSQFSSFTDHLSSL